jgi:quercetin dioxygenase-like cupin family protein
MRVVRPAETVATEGGAHFTGPAWLQEPRDGWGDGYRATVVHFAPGTKNDWHHHPGGQVLFVLTGRGRVVAERDDGGIHEEVFGPGDIVVADPGECHWHGAADDSFMSHLSVTAETTVWGNARPNEPPDCAN